MRPTIGRIVHYFEPQAEGAIGEPNEHAAVITQVHSETCVDLEVLHRDKAKSARLSSVVSMKGDSKGWWEWPKREPATMPDKVGR